MKYVIAAIMICILAILILQLAACASPNKVFSSPDLYKELNQ